MSRLAVVLLVLCAGPALAQNSSSPFPQAQEQRIREVLRHVYSLDYEKANALCESMIREMPEDPIGYVYLARAYWSEYLNREQALSIYRFAAQDFFSNYNKYKVRIDEEAEKRFRETTRIAIEKARNILKRTPNDLRVKYLLGVAYQNLASFEATVTHGWWSSFMNGDKNIRQHREVQVRMPQFADPRLATGVYDYVAASVSWKIRWLSMLLGHPGSKTRGKAELERVVKEARLVSDDARTLLAVLYTRDGEYAKALEHLQHLHSSHPTNYLLHIEIADMYVRLKQPERAIAEYGTLLKMIRSGTRGYGRLEEGIVQYRLGMAQRAFRNLPAAETQFRSVLGSPASSRHSRFSAQLELAKTLDIVGKRDEAVSLYRAVVAQDPFGFYRKEAETWLQKPYRGI